ncbi:MAG TPA: response regulator [Blastocatellia bacterium]|nr:response regulator [Blastocatellia bacterium]
MRQRSWTFDVSRCLDASGRLLPPDRIELGLLIDTTKILRLQIQLSIITHMEASVYLYDEDFPLPLVHDALPLLVQSPLCRELNKLEDRATGLPRCVIDTWQASLKAMKELRPVSADCVGGRKTLWSCPIILTFEGRRYPKASLTVAAYPILNFYGCAELERLFPEGNPALGTRYQQAFDLALDGEKLQGVRDLVQILAESFSEEITARYEYAHRYVLAGGAASVTSEPRPDLRHLVETISQIAHDINNRLTSINLYAQILNHSLSENEEVAENLGLIRTEARQAIETVRELAQSARTLVDTVAASSSPTAPVTEPTVEEMERKRILVVDDEKAVAELIRRILQSHNYIVDTTLDGEAAIGLIEANRYDLIVADLKMPGVGGMELFQHFSRVDPEIARRIVFLSGDVISPHTLTFLRDTQSLYLTKPCTIEELLGFVKTALQRSATR